MIQADKLDAMFRVDIDTGRVFWKESESKPGRSGNEAGRQNKQGYIRICVGQDVLLAHRVVWAIHHGEWPSMFIDHINGNPSDNRITNLRLATHSQNLQNRPASKNSKTGIKGVSWSKVAKKWTARIMANRKLFCLGYFDTIESAAAAYSYAATTLHGEFKRTE